MVVESDTMLPAWIEGVAEGTRAELEAAMAATEATDSLLHAQRDAFYGPNRSCAPGALILFHGTSWENAESIERDGFVPSEAGCLGPGIYVGRCDKALRFARDAARHGGMEGGLVKVRVTIRNPKFVSSDDTTWQDEGHDACRADHTSRSEHMEWCVSDAAQLEVVQITRVPIDAASATDSSVLPVPSEVLPPARPLTAQALRDHEREVAASGVAGGGGVDESVRRQFHCPSHGLFWARVRCAAKQVAHCRHCDAAVHGGGRGPRYVAIPVADERGRGDFMCAVCGKQWSSNQACRLLGQYCTRRGCEGGEVACYPQTITKPEPRPGRGGGGGGGTGGGGPNLEGIPEDAPARPPPPHRCSGCGSGACRRPPPFSAVHESTGSTLPTLSAATFSQLGRGDGADGGGSPSAHNAPVPWAAMVGRDSRRGRGGRGGRGARGGGDGSSGGGGGGSGGASGRGGRRGDGHGVGHGDGRSAWSVPFVFTQQQNALLAQQQGRGMAAQHPSTYYNSYNMNNMSNNMNMMLAHPPLPAATYVSPEGQMMASYLHEQMLREQREMGGL